MEQEEISMKTKRLWLAWLYMFALCAVLGFIPEPYGLIKALLVIAAVCFFIPGVLLLLKGNHKTTKRVMLLSGIALVLSTVLIIFNFASALLPPVWGTVFYILMGILANPILCGQYWILSLFGWACLLAGGMFKQMEKR
jgi:membrane-associated protease RseP (regulator of RpoE activity)